MTRFVQRPAQFIHQAQIGPLDRSNQQIGTAIVLAIPSMDLRDEMQPAGANSELQDK